MIDTKFKSMKHTTLMQFLIIGFLISVATPLKAQLTEITAVDGVKYKIGDKLKMGQPVDASPSFRHIYMAFGDKLSDMKECKTPALDSIQIISMKEKSDVKGEYVVISRMDVTSKMFFSFRIAFNKAIETGEIVSKNSNYFVAPTSEKSLEQLKKAKEKLDLGLITKAEYDKKVIELKKYIKD
jgi:hypothetical protein